MITEVVTLSIDGATQDDLVPDILEIAVEEDVASADVFRVRIALTPRSDGSWPYLDEERFQVWKRVTIEAGYPERVEPIMDGYVTHVEVKLGGADGSHLEVSGMDGSVLLDLEEKQLAWANKKDNEIAQQIFQSYGLSYEVEDTVVQHAEALSTILQSETDIRFLRRLAARNGFECGVRGGTGFFRSPNLSEPPQKLLAVEFGDETNLLDLELRVDGTPATAGEIRRVNPLEKRAETETLTRSPRRALGSKSLDQLRSGLPAGHLLLRNHAPGSSSEMLGRLRSAYEPASGFVKAAGSIDSRSYQSVLRTRKLVTLKGAGASYSGTYYVTQVRHRFTLAGYAQEFEARRNGLGLTGEEQFDAPLLPLAVIPGLGNQSAASGNRVLPAQQTGSILGGGF
jgi:phage protein D